MIALLFFLIAAPAQADAPALEFDASVVDFSKFSRDGESSRYIGPEGSVLSVDEEKIAPEQAKKDLKNRLLQLQLLFAPHGAQYPGMLTKDASCKDRTRLASKTSETKDSLYWFSELPATQTFVYGSCGAIAEPFWSEKLLLYCKAQGTLYDVRFFTKKKSPIGRPLARYKS